MGCNWTFAPVCDVVSNWRNTIVNTRAFGNDPEQIIKLSQIYMEEMKKNVAGVLELTMDRVNIKATTEEGLGFTGSGEGISAQAVCLLHPLLDGVADSRMTPSGCAGCSGCLRN